MKKLRHCRPMYRDNLLWSVQKRLNRLRCHLGHRLRWAYGMRFPHVKGQVSRWKGAGPEMSSGQYTQSDSVGGSTSMVQMQLGVY